MNDEAAAPEGGNDQGTGSAPEVRIHNIYVKDVSFEAPNSPAMFRAPKPPQIQMNLGVRTQGLDQDVHEVTLTVTATARSGEQTAFLVEVQQAGIFGLKGFDPEQLQAVLGVYCPNILFPYAREAVSSLVSRGGFPPLLLEPVNFEALFARHRQQAAEARTDA